MPKIFALRDSLLRVQNSLLCNPEIHNKAADDAAVKAVKTPAPPEISTSGCGLFGVLSKLGEIEYDSSRSAVAVAAEVDDEDVSYESDEKAARRDNPVIEAEEADGDGVQKGRERGLIGKAGKNRLAFWQASVN